MTRVNRMLIPNDNGEVTDATLDLITPGQPAVECEATDRLRTMLMVGYQQLRDTLDKRRPGEIGVIAEAPPQAYEIVRKLTKQDDVLLVRAGWLSLNRLRERAPERADMLKALESEEKGVPVICVAANGETLVGHVNVTATPKTVVQA